MAVTYGFYNSLNKDRVYNAEQMSSIFNGIITDGVFASIGGSLMPIAGTGMQVVVKTGKCWFNSTWTLNDALLPLDIPAADVSLTRIDAVVVEINSAISTRANTIKVVKGTPSANPAKPILANTETLHQYALGYVTVSAGVTSVTADKIEVNVGKSTCPFITSVLQQTDITALFNQWDAEFTAWFENVQAQLSGNVAANLQRQIDERVKIADKASGEEAIAGVSDTKWITPKGLKAAGDNILKPGDIIYKTNKMQKDGFLRCNGSAISLDDYPRLKPVLDKYDILVSSEAITKTSDYISHQYITFIDGYGIAFCRKNPGVFILIIDPVSKTITQHLLANKADTNNRIPDVCFFGKVNNQYIALMQLDTTYHYIAVSASLQGNYSIIPWIRRLTDASYLQRIIYKDSQYMIGVMADNTFVSSSLSGNFEQYNNDVYPAWIYRGNHFYVVDMSGRTFQIYKRATLDGSNLKTINLFTTNIPSSYVRYPGYPCDLFDLDDDHWYILFYSNLDDQKTNSCNIWVFDNDGNRTSTLAFTTKNELTISSYIQTGERLLGSAGDGTYFFTNPLVGNYITEKQTFSSLNDFTKISESVLPIFSNGIPRVTHAQNKYIILNCNTNSDKWYLAKGLKNAAILPNMPAIDIASPYIKF